jgi:hypothetical protein
METVVESMHTCTAVASHFRPGRQLAVLYDAHVQCTVQGQVKAEIRRVFHVFLKNAAAQRRDQRRRAAAQIAPRSGAWRRAAPQEAGERSRVIKERFSRVACSRIFRHLVTLSVSRFSHIRTHTDTRTDKGYICRPLPRAHRQNRVAETHKARKIPARSARSACT